MNRHHRGYHSAAATQENVCCGGFTLVETIVMVCVGIAVLSVIVPALGESRRRGKDTVCTQNLHRIIQASHIYAGRDPNESIIPAGAPEWNAAQIDQVSGFTRFAAYAYGGKSGRGFSSPNKPINTASVYGPAYKMNAVHRPLNHILFRDLVVLNSRRPGRNGSAWRPDAELLLNVYHCPADSGASGMNEDLRWLITFLTSYDYYGTSYAANAMWITDLSIQPPRLTSNSPYLRPLSRVPNPARTIGYMENNGRYAWRATPDICPSAIGLPGEVQGWHGKKWTFVTAFVDGGVNTIRMKGHRPEPIAHSAVANPQSIECMTARGDGWQLDTLPSPPIVTDHFPPQGGIWRFP